MIIRYALMHFHGTGQSPLLAMIFFLSRPESMPFLVINYAGLRNRSEEYLLKPFLVSMAAWALLTEL